MSLIQSHLWRVTSVHTLYYWKIECSCRKKELLQMGTYVASLWLVSTDYRLRSCRNSVVHTPGSMEQSAEQPDVAYQIRLSNNNKVPSLTHFIRYEFIAMHSKAWLPLLLNLNHVQYIKLFCIWSSRSFTWVINLSIPRNRSTFSIELWLTRVDFVQRLCYQSVLEFPRPWESGRTDTSCLQEVDVLTLLTQILE